MTKTRCTCAPEQVLLGGHDHPRGFWMETYHAPDCAELTE